MTDFADDLYDDLRRGPGKGSGDETPNDEPNDAASAPSAGATPDGSQDAVLDASETEAVPADMRSGFVAILGKPNVGKSTLLNTLLGVKVAPISPNPQTTRRAVRGIGTDVEPGRQAPGVREPRVSGRHVRRGERGRKGGA